MTRLPDKCSEWKAKIPDPPDVIGIARKYNSETYKKVRNTSMDLMRSIPHLRGGIRTQAEGASKGP